MLSRCVTTMILLLALALAASAQDTPPTTPPVRTLTVTAEAVRDVFPDTAVASIAIVSNGETVAKAVAINNKYALTVVAAVKALKVTGLTIKTCSYTVQPVYAQEVQPAAPDAGAQPLVGSAAPDLTQAYVTEQKLTGYEVQNLIEFRVTQSPPDATDTTGLSTDIGQVIDAALKAGANRVDAVNFFLADESQILAQLASKASNSAYARAKALAGGVNASLGPVISISDGSYPMLPSYHNTAFSAYGATPYAYPYATPGTPLEAGTLTLQVSVAVTFELK
jgi:uncharacterized protein